MDFDTLPGGLLEWLDDWGPRMKQKVTAALGQCGPATAFPSTLLVGTDCSGIEAPIHALHGLGISHEHCWSLR